MDFYFAGFGGVNAVEILHEFSIKDFEGLEQFRLVIVGLMLDLITISFSLRPSQHYGG